MSDSVIVSGGSREFNLGTPEFERTCPKCERTFGPYFNEGLLREAVQAHRTATLISGTAHEA